MLFFNQFMRYAKALSQDAWRADNCTGALACKLWYNGCVLNVLLLIIHHPRLEEVFINV